MKIEEIIKEANEKVFDIMKIINNYNKKIFSDLLYIQYRIKSEKNILKKMQKIGSDNIFDVYDLIGVKYVFNNMDTSLTLMNNILNDSNFYDTIIKDYSKTGHPEDPDYKAIHLRTKFQGYPCEIEIMDEEISEHVILTHNDYKNGLLKK